MTTNAAVEVKTDCMNCDNDNLSKNGLLAVPISLQLSCCNCIIVMSSTVMKMTMTMRMKMKMAMEMEMAPIMMINVCMYLYEDLQN